MAAIYGGECFCDSCAEKIKETILAEASPAEIKNFQNERNYDSDEFPKYMSDDEESDYPSHCASSEDCLEYEVLSDGSKIGKLLSNNLTEYGAQYVREIIEGGGSVAEFWQEQFDWV